MMEEKDRHALILAKIDDAEEMLKVAEMNYQYEFYNSAVNRLYYACFHIASAALLSIGIEGIHRHEGVRSMFSLHFIKEGRIGSEWKSFYATMVSYRSTADYDNLKRYSREQVEELIPLVSRFIAELKNFILSASTSVRL